MVVPYVVDILSHIRYLSFNLVLEVRIIIHSDDVLRCARLLKLSLLNIRIVHQEVLTVLFMLLHMKHMLREVNKDIQTSTMSIW